jgi:hypothetical protein
MRTASILVLVALACVLDSRSADAVIIASGDGTGNTTAPPGEPGWDHVGLLGGLTGVYVGNGWVLVARHGPTADLELDGVTHRAIGTSRLAVSGNADLSMLRIESDPGLPDLSIATTPPSGDLLLMGKGRNRGVAIDWDPDPFDDGWSYGAGTALRWGTNEVAATSLLLDTGYQTVTFATDFSETGQSPHEAVAATGDSGGAVFPDDGSSELTGIMLLTAGYVGQPGATVLFGNVTYSAQLANYRNQILAIRADTACSNGIDDDSDGFTDYPEDIGCQDADDAFERLDSLPCDDGFDDDEDGAVDYPEDVGCPSPAGTLEDPACSDGIDNDGDGQIDWDGGAWINGGEPLGPIDTFCSSPAGTREKAKSCGLGFELALLVPALAGVRRKLHRRS